MPPANRAGDQFDTLVVVRHKPVLEDSLKPSRLCRVFGRNGGQFRRCRDGGSGRYRNDLAAPVCARRGFQVFWQNEAKFTIIINRSQATYGPGWSILGPAICRSRAHMHWPTKRESFAEGRFIQGLLTEQAVGPRSQLSTPRFHHDPGHAGIVREPLGRVNLAYLREYSTRKNTVTAILLDVPRLELSSCAFYGGNPSLGIWPWARNKSPLHSASQMCFPNHAQARTDARLRPL